MTDRSSLPPSGSVLPDATMRPRDVAALQHRLPTFWPNNGQLWFAQVEATFDFHHISSEISRFRHLPCNFSPEVAQEVEDVVAAPLNDAQCRSLKQNILDRTTSESMRLRHLLTMEELGDRRPSQLLSSMRQLLRAISDQAAVPVVVDGGKRARKVHCKGSGDGPSRRQLNRWTGASTRDGDSGLDRPLREGLPRTKDTDQLRRSKDT
ncbi:hypothetical protein HPB50_004175 [Hyalomma asiaticum]|uniref:Uncharacterized protein n=1 Tax=Hyalomma asiaticum TaxID=266040 RepID=A0ACB7RH87_HYAAI|nr:hypothetical protein HPB50_004175 [Hyalomma asiaticum]